MNLEKVWYRSEFVQHEMLLAHRAVENEFAFYIAIADGNIDYVKDNCYSKTFVNPDGMGILSKNPIQNMRYHFVITTAMTTRYCVYSGMEQEKAYSLSDFYIQKMDKLHTVAEIADLHDKRGLVFGIPISEYILNLKIEKAKNLLQYSDYSIVDISNYLAFSSQSHFIQVFQKKTGTTPHKYRTKYFRSNWHPSSV